MNIQGTTTPELAITFNYHQPDVGFTKQVQTLALAGTTSVVVAQDDLLVSTTVLKPLTQADRILWVGSTGIQQFDHDVNSSVTTLNQDASLADVFAFGEGPIAGRYTAYTSTTMIYVTDADVITVFDRTPLNTATRTYTMTIPSQGLSGAANDFPFRITDADMPVGFYADIQADGIDIDGLMPILGGAVLPSTLIWTSGSTFTMYIKASIPAATELVIDLVATTVPSARYSALEDTVYNCIVDLEAGTGLTDLISGNTLTIASGSIVDTTPTDLAAYLDLTYPNTFDIEKTGFYMSGCYDTVANTLHQTALAVGDSAVAANRAALMVDVLERYSAYMSTGTGFHDDVSRSPTLGLRTVSSFNSYLDEVTEANLGSDLFVEGVAGTLDAIGWDDPTKTLNRVWVGNSSAIAGEFWKSDLFQLRTANEQLDLGFVEMESKNMMHDTGLTILETGGPAGQGLRLTNLTKHTLMFGEGNGASDPTIIGTGSTNKRGINMLITINDWGTNTIKYLATHDEFNAYLSIEADGTFGGTWYANSSVNTNAVLLYIDDERYAKGDQIKTILNDGLEHRINFTHAATNARALHTEFVNCTRLNGAEIVGTDHRFASVDVRSLASTVWYKQMGATADSTSINEAITIDLVDANRNDEYSRVTWRETSLLIDGVGPISDIQLCYMEHVSGTTMAHASTVDGAVLDVLTPYPDTHGYFVSGWNIHNAAAKTGINNAVCTCLQWEDDELLVLTSGDYIEIIFEYFGNEQGFYGHQFLTGNDGLGNMLLENKTDGVDWNWLPANAEVKFDDVVIAIGEDTPMVKGAEHKIRMTIGATDGDLFRFFAPQLGLESIEEHYPTLMVKSIEVSIAGTTKYNGLHALNKGNMVREEKTDGYGTSDRTIFRGTALSKGFIFRNFRRPDSTGTNFGIISDFSFRQYSS